MARRGARLDDRWDAHPVLAWWVRAAVLLVPLVVSVLVALGVIALLPEPGSVVEHVGWWVAVLGSAFGAAQLVDRLARRALPLALLLQLALVFPDRAPSRLQAARRTSLREIEHQVAALQDAGEEGEPAEAARTLVSLVGALGLHDKRTRGHSERVRAYVDMLTEEMGLPEEDRSRLRWSALIHDIGKLSVPAPVLNGGRDLHEEEWAALRSHPVEGERLAAALLPWLGEWGLCVREHHERWDGGGYPQGLVGTEISLGARIVAVADAFEVMTANRSYQKAISPAAAKEELARCAGKDFDPAVVRAFLQLSIGRLRGVLGPLSFLPALPFTAAADRAGDAAKGMTTVAAVSAVALAVAGSSAAPPARVPPALGSGEPAVTLPTPVPQPPPTPTPSPMPAPVTREPVVSPVARPSPQPRPVVEAPRPRPAPTPAAELAPALFLAADAVLLEEVPVQGTVVVAQGGTPTTFSVQVGSLVSVRGSVSFVLFDQLVTRHGSGQPSAGVTVDLADCGPAGCRVLSTGSAALVRAASGWARQVVPMSPVDAVVPAGHALRVSLYLVSRRNVTGLRVGYGGATASRLLLP